MALDFVCREVTRTRAVPGTGGIHQVPDISWNATARSVERVVNGGYWRYSFLPNSGAVFITGLFDDSVSQIPQPSLYVIATEFQLNKIFVHYGTSVSSPISWSGGRISIVSSPPYYHVINGNNLAWTSS